MPHVTGQWAGKCEVCNDSRDVMWVSESISRRSTNRWGVRTTCHVASCHRVSLPGEGGLKCWPDMLMCRLCNRGRSPALR